MPPFHRLIPINIVGAIASLMLIVLIATPAWAGMSAEDMQLLETHLERGRDHLDEGNYESAIEDLDEARQIHDHPLISVNIAEAFRKLGRCSEAKIEYDALAERDDLDDESTEDFEAGRAQLDQCVEMTGLTIECIPEDAQIWLQTSEREAQFDCPYDKQTPVGEVQIKVVSETFEPKTFEISLTAGENKAVEIKLEAVAEDADEAVEEDADEEDESVDAPAEIEESVADEPSWPTVVGFGAIGVGAALIAGGGVVDYGSRSRAAELAEARDAADQERFDSLADTGDSRRLMAAIFYGSGLSLVAGGAILQFIDFSSTSSEEPTFSVGAAPTGVTAIFQW